MLLQVGHCMGVFVGYIAVALLVLVPVRPLTDVPPFVFRKLLHIVAFSCVSLMVLSAASWQAAAMMMDRGMTG